MLQPLLYTVSHRALVSASNLNYNPNIRIFGYSDIHLYGKNTADCSYRQSTIVRNIDRQSGTKCYPICRLDAIRGSDSLSTHVLRRRL
jgi:hypothetical protein